MVRVVAADLASDSWSLMFQKLLEGRRRLARFIFGAEKRAHSSVG